MDALLPHGDADNSSIAVNGNGENEANVTLPLQDGETPTTTILNCAANLTNVIIGAGLLGVPLAVYQAGFVTGCIMLVLIGVVEAYSLRLMVEAGRRVHKYDFEDLCEHCFGRYGYLLNLFTIFSLDYGSCVAYLIIIGDTLTEVIKDYTDSPTWTNRRVVIAMCASLAILPLSMLKDMKSLSFISIISTGAVFGIILIIGIEGFGAHIGQNVAQAFDQAVGKLLINSDLFTAFGTMAFAYVCHDVAFQVFQSLENPTPKRWARTVNLSMFMAFVISVLTGVLGFGGYFGELKSNILNNLDSTDAFANVARVVMGVCLFFKYPLSLFMCRHITHKFIQLTCGSCGATTAGYAPVGDTNHAIPRSVSIEGDKTRPVPAHLIPPPFTWTRHIITTVALWAVNLLLALFISDLGIVQSFVGGFSAVTLGFILPAACAIQVNVMDTPDQPGVKTWMQKALTKQNSGPILLFVFGSIILIACMIQSVQTYS